MPKETASDGPWPSPNGVSPISYIPDNPTDIKAVIFGTIHFPFVGKRVAISKEKCYKVAGLTEKGDVQLVHEKMEPPWDLSYYLYVPLASWWAMVLRRALGISRSVEQWTVALDATNDPWISHTRTTTNGSLMHVYEISFSTHENENQPSSLCLKQSLYPATVNDESPTV